MEHSLVGASSCQRWWNCPGSVALLKKIPEEKETSIYADEGTVAHMLAEIGLKKGMKEVRSYEEELIEVGDTEIEVTEEMIEAVDEYVCAIEKDLKNLDLNSSNLEIEKQFNLKSISKEAFGTCDAVITEPFGLLRVYDFKYGAGVSVNVIDNKQLLYYALGAAEGKDIEEIELIIIQPRARHSETTIRRWRTSVEYLNKFESDLKFKIKITEKKNAELKTGDWCKFCKAKTSCPEIKKTVVQTTKMDFNTQVIPPNPGKLLPRDISKILSFKDLIIDWLKAIESEGYKILQRGGTIEGFKLIQKRANRKWISEDDVIEEYGDQFGTKIYNTKLRTPAQIEKIIGKDFNFDLCEYPEGGIIIVPELDKRSPIKATAIDDFS